MSPLFRLPYELLAFVVQQLDLADTHALSLTCKRLQFLFLEPNIAKKILESKAPSSLEARCARVSKRYPAELRRLVKRREAVSSVSPYLAAVVAVAESWIFENGVLCHIHERELRILDLHQSQSNEIIVDIRSMLDEAIDDDDESLNSRKYKFQLLYYSHDVVSCLYSYGRPTHHWLIVFNAREGRVLGTHHLDSSFKIFVRNNDKFLCYGVFKSTGGESARHWVAGAYDLVSKTWTHDLDLPEPMGSDIGSTICFEIFDDFLYGVSSQTSLEVEEADWMSYYTCFRIPLTLDGFQNIEHAPRRQLWRRSHLEGPIDDRWSFLRIFKDETTSQLRIVESRKEWLASSSSARRTYYTSEIVFGAGGDRDQSHTPDLEDGSFSYASQLSGESASKSYQRDLPILPPRDPHMVHPGDDGSASLMFTCTKSPVRSYHSSSQTFHDLVDDPPFFDPSAQRIRIRGGSRHRWTARESDERKRFLETKKGEKSLDTFDLTLAELYKHEDVVFWPPEQDPTKPDGALDALYSVLNPSGHHGSVRGTWDDRSILYAIEGADGYKVLVFLSFDPSLRLEGIQPYPGNLNFGKPSCVPHGNFVSGGLGLNPEAAVSYEGKEKNKEVSMWCPPLNANTTECSGRGTASSESADSASSTQWRKCGPAMYQDIRHPVGYHFAL